MPDPMWRYACPRCASPLSDEEGGVQACANCGTSFEARDGLYRFLLPEQLADLQPFLAQYRAVREKDGYRLRLSPYYRSLPLVDSRDPQAGVWRVRRKSFDSLCRRVLAAFNRRPLSILDLGAGNGWLSHRLSGLGHRCAAVDWLDDAEDGLGARVHYPIPFTCVQADFEHLPFRPGQFDLVVFNAALHYACDVRATLRHAQRMLVPGGALVVMDSPTFRTDADGRRMVAEKAEQFKAAYGLKDVVQWGAGYLTTRGMAEAGRELGLEFCFYPSRVGLSWELRRLLAGIKKRREPARFGLWIGAAPSPR